jgi:AcrR family transcriptional regulator
LRSNRSRKVALDPTSPASRKGPKSVASRARILEAAARLFADRGYAGTTMRSVGKAAGMESATIYYHFQSKEVLIEAVLVHGLTETFRSVTETVANLPKDASSRARLLAAISAHLTWIIEHGPFSLASRRVMGQVPATLRRRHLVRQAHYGRYWTALIREGIDAGEFRPNVKPHQVSMFMLGALNWAAEWFRPQRVSLSTLAEDLADYVLKGILEKATAPDESGRLAAVGLADAAAGGQAP